jgi:hypothetical protein
VRRRLQLLDERGRAGRGPQLVARSFAQSSPGCEPTGVIFTF